MTVPAEFAEMAQHVFSLEGRTVLYIEGTQLLRVLVSNVSASEDGQGFKAVATVVPTHGLASKYKSWIFGAGWQYFHATEDVVKATYGGWRIYTSSAVMEELAEILKPLPERSTYWSDYEWKPIEGNKHINASGTPGPIAKRVMNFLRNH